MTISSWTIGVVAIALGSLCADGVSAGQFGTPKDDEGTRIFKTDEHPYYSGQFHLTGQQAVLIGSMNDQSPWDHMDYAGKQLQSVQGTIEIDVNERTNSG